MSYLKVESIDHLIELCGDTREDFFIHMGAGRSSKGISYDPDFEEFDIHHEIDDSFQTVKKKHFEKKCPNIFAAIDSGAFYKY